MAYKAKLKARIELPTSEQSLPSPFLLTSGTFQEGGVTVSKHGFTFEPEKVGTPTFSGQFELEPLPSTGISNSPSLDSFSRLGAAPQSDLHPVPSSAEKALPASTGSPGDTYHDDMADEFCFDMPNTQQSPAHSSSLPLSPAPNVAHGHRHSYSSTSTSSLRTSLQHLAVTRARSTSSSSLLRQSGSGAPAPASYSPAAALADTSAAQRTHGHQYSRTMSYDASSGRPLGEDVGASSGAPLTRVAYHGSGSNLARTATVSNHPLARSASSDGLLHELNDEFVEDEPAQSYSPAISSYSSFNPNIPANVARTLIQLEGRDPSVLGRRSSVIPIEETGYYTGSAAQSRLSSHVSLTQTSASSSPTGPNRGPAIPPTRPPLAEVRLEDLDVVGVIGRGSGGAVHRALHGPSGQTIALKVIPLDVTDRIRKQILLELRTLYEANCPYVVRFHGAFFHEGSISIALEYMDAGSLHSVAEAAEGGIPELVLAKVAEQILHGLVYLHKERHVIHRDIKPSNLLINRQGQVKITDFGVSGHLATSISSCVSWVGTITYMSPERIRGHSYSVMSDIWSFGLSMMELALGHFPFPLPSANDGSRPSGNNEEDRQQIDLEASGSVRFFELLYHIVEQPSPTLSSATFSPEFVQFCADCLHKEPSKRPTAQQLLGSPFIRKHKATAFDLGEWVSQRSRP